MKTNAWIGMLVAAMVVGCQSSAPPPVNSPPADEYQIGQIREQFQSINPRTLVGAVVDVNGGDSLAAVGDVDVSDFHEGDTVCFIDSRKQPIVCGSVVRTTTDQVHVKYEAPAAGHRAPRAEISPWRSGKCLACNNASRPDQ